jgi:hypothetical protein
VTHQLGSLHGVERKRVEDTLIERYEPPEKAVTVSVQLDRFAVAMEELKPRRPGRPKKNAPARPIAVKWHMAFSGAVTLHDEDGEALEAIKYEPWGRTCSASGLLNDDHLVRRSPRRGRGRHPAKGRASRRHH